MQEYQNAARLTAADGLDLVYFFGKLSVEANEALQLVLKHLYHDKPLVVDPDLIEELGDCLWYVAMAANHLGYSLEDVAVRNVAKLRGRHLSGTVAGMGDAVDSYHIRKQIGQQSWLAVPHKLLHGAPLPYDEAVRQVLSGFSCYVTAEDVDQALEHLRQMGFEIEKAG